MNIDSSQITLAINRLTAPDVAPQSENAKRRNPEPAAAVPHGAPGRMPQARQFEVSSSFGEGHLVVYRIIDKETGDLVEQVPPGQADQAAQQILQSTEAGGTVSRTVDIES
jgi:hypothetical protein